MHDQLIAVRPVPGGWAVDCPFAGQHLLFLSGAAAERKAKSLALCAAGAGLDAEVRVYDRRETLVGTSRYSAHPERRRR
jgi:hypothetical protein